MILDLLKVILTLSHATSPSNHHLEEYVLLFSGTLSKSKQLDDYVYIYIFIPGSSIFFILCAVFPF